MPVGGESGFNFIERRFECKQLEGIVLVKPGGEGAQHDRDAARERARVILAQTELERIDGRGGHIGHMARRGTLFFNTNNSRHVTITGYFILRFLHSAGHGHAPHTALSKSLIIFTSLSMICPEYQLI